MRQQLRQLSGDTAIYGISTIVQRFLSFLLTPFYTHVLTRGELGVQATIYVMISFILIIANAGMESAYFRFVSTAETDEDRRRVYWSAFGVNIVAALGIAIVIALFPSGANSIAVLGLDSERYDLIRMAAAIVFLDSSAAIAFAALRMERRARTFGGIKVATIVVNVGLNIWFVAVLQMGIRGVFLAGILQSLFQLVVLIPFVIRHLPIRFSPQTARSLLRFGLPTIASGLALIALQGIDRPIMRFLTGEATVGLYQAGYRMGIVMMIFVSMFEFAWRPFFLQQAAETNARALFARIFTYYNLIAASIFLVGSFFTVVLTTVPIPFTSGRAIIAPNFWDGLSVVPIVLGAYLFSGWYTNFIVGIYIEKKTSALPWITGVGALTEALLCFVLIPTMGYVGGAWGTLAAYVVMSVVLLRYVQRFYRIEYEWWRVSKILVAAAISYMADRIIVGQWFDQRSWEGVGVHVAALVLFPVVLYVFGFFRSGELAELRKRIGRA